LYGRNLLHSDDPPRDPMGPRFTVKHPPKSEWIEAQFRKFEAKSGEKLERTPRTDLLLGVDDDE
jgi:hypothetical protein